MLFIDYSSAFNTIVPSKLFIKLETLGLDPALCNWVLDFLAGRPQVVRVGNKISTPLILNTGTPQGCVLSPLLYSLFTHDFVAMHASKYFFYLYSSIGYNCMILFLTAGFKSAREKREKYLTGSCVGAYVPCPSIEYDMLTI
jgi:hypothetical protein